MTELNYVTAPEAPVADESFTVSNGQFNRSAIKRQALKVSKQTRAGKFTRVSEAFVDEIIANIEAKIRLMLVPVNNSPFGQVEADEEDFLTGAGKKRLTENFNVWVAREIHRRINMERTGKTL